MIRRATAAALVAATLVVVPVATGSASADTKRPVHKYGMNWG